MAQLLVHIDSDLKQKLKAKLAREGKTLRVWVTEQAIQYLQPAEPPRPNVTKVKARPRPKPNPAPRPVPPPLPKVKPVVVHPQAGYIPSRDYNMEED